ncbi:hypothetical protein D9M71_159690 [compost metagenome]
MGVGQHHHVILGAGECLYPLQVGSAGAIDVLAHRHRADEGDGAHVRVGQQRIHLFATAVDHLQHALGRAGFDEEFGEAVGGQRILLRGLEDEGVAAGDRQRKHPQRDHRREVERGDADADAQGLDPAGGVDLAGNVFHRLAHHQARHVGGVFSHLDAAPDIALGVGIGLAGLAGQQFRQFVVMFL